jgi:serine/threonine protein kinase
MNERISEPAFRQWIEDSLARGENILAVSNQGTILHYERDGLELVVKSAMGRGPVRSVRQRTLLREYEAYQRMEGTDRERWFKELLAVLRSFHDRGVSHGDLKSKSNILVTHDQKPCVIDFGTAFIRKPGFHPVNNRLFEHGCRMDINAWVKHKYHGRYEDIEGADLELLDYSKIEYLVRKLSGRRTDVIPRK